MLVAQLEYYFISQEDEVVSHRFVWFMFFLYLELYPNSHLPSNILSTISCWYLLFILLLLQTQVLRVRQADEPCIGLT